MIFPQARPFRGGAVPSVRPAVLRGRFVIRTRNPFAFMLDEHGQQRFPGAKPDRFFMAELDSLWRLDRAEAERILDEYLAAGWNSIPTGPIVEYGYSEGGQHGRRHYPDTNWLGDPDGFADFLAWLTSKGCHFRLYLAPNCAPYFKGTGVGWDMEAVERDLTPFYRHPRIQALVTDTVTAWEEYAPIVEMGKIFGWQVRLFPKAEPSWHNPPKHLGAGNSDEDEGDCNRAMAKAGIRCHRIQTVPPNEYRGGVNEFGRTACGQHEYDLWDMQRRYGHTDKPGPEGQHAGRPWGDVRLPDGSKMRVVLEECCAFGDYWTDEDAAAEYTAAALRQGITEILDGLPLEAR